MYIPGQEQGGPPVQISDVLSVRVRRRGADAGTWS